MTQYAQYRGASSGGRTRTIMAYYSAHVSRVNMIGLAVVLVAATVYIAQVNRTVARGYAIRELETSIRTLQEENQRLDLTMREAQSLDRVSSSVAMLGMVEGGTPHYVSASGPSYALAR